MEEIYREQYPDGSHTVYAGYFDNGVQISDYQYGGGVETFWNNDEIEYNLTIPKDEMPKFFVEVLAKVFNAEEKFGIHQLKDMCEAKGIKYNTHIHV
ncbi:MAG: hypothetical protein VXA26_06005 [Candidatus Neomarinimicrobiota bacterium]|jgi:hypothetical protein